MEPSFNYMHKNAVKQFLAGPFWEMVSKGRLGGKVVKGLNSRVKLRYVGEL